MGRMEDTFGKRLQAARKANGYRTQEALGEIIGVSGKTIRNWETDRHRPDPGAVIALRKLLGNFDVQGDPVEVAVRQSELTEDRQYDVIGYYKRQVREQREAAAS
jgi:transcriptional regulator with XRE-family HTH domain